MEDIAPSDWIQRRALWRYKKALASDNEFLKKNLEDKTYIAYREASILDYLDFKAGKTNPKIYGANENNDSPS